MLTGTLLVSCQLFPWRVAAITGVAFGGAAYEVHITKADGTHATVLEDSAHKVLSTKTETHAGHHG